MANDKQAPPGLNGPSIYGRTLSAIADVLREEEEQEANQPTQRASRLGIERPQDYVQRAAREGTSAVVSFSTGGLLSPKKMPKEPKTSKLTEAQKVFLEIARKRQQYKNRGKA
jgi:hypothetical protein